MGSSKVILVGAISVVFGLYSLSLYRVNGYLGNTAEVASYINRAADNAKTGMQRALDIWSRGNDHDQPKSNDFPMTETFNLLDPAPTVDKFIDSVSITTPPNWFDYNDNKLYTLRFVSHGYYRAPNEPPAFQGHEVIRTAYVQFKNSNVGSDNHPWYQLTLTSVYTTVNYAAEKQLEVLQGAKPNLLGY